MTSNKVLPYIDRQRTALTPGRTYNDDDDVVMLSDFHSASDPIRRNSSASPTKILYSKRTSAFTFRALVVDDAPLNRKMLSRVLVDCCGPNCCSVCKASDGLVALDLVQKNLNGTDVGSRIDIVLIDFVMPNMNGPVAVKEMRALGYDGVIVGVTGNALAEDIECFMRNGADRVLIKPVNAKLLGSLVEGM